jgi:hypothetical protein
VLMRGFIMVFCRYELVQEVKEKARPVLMLVKGSCYPS